MDTRPNPHDEQFQTFLAKLTAPQHEVWSEKQQIELDMARDLSVEMLRVAESIRAAAAEPESWLLLLKYAKVLDFILTSLAARRDIHPQTLRAIFKLAKLKIDEAYPD